MEIDDEAVKGIGILALASLVISALVWGPILNGWVLVKLWTWFIVPTFGLPALRIPIAIGFSIIVSMFKTTRASASGKKYEASDWITSVLLTATIPLVSLFFGWIVVKFV